MKAFIFVAFFFATLAFGAFPILIPLAILWLVAWCETRHDPPDKDRDPDTAPPPPRPPTRRDPPPRPTYPRPPQPTRRPTYHHHRN